jgi:hypothetical protein
VKFSKENKSRAVLQGIEKFGDYIKLEVLANDLAFSSEFSGAKVELFEGVDLGLEVTQLKQIFDY